jgi:prefoldin subunit 5
VLRRKDRARQFVEECRSRFETIERSKDEDHTIEVLVSAGPQSVSIGTIGAISNDFIICKGTNAAGELQAIIAPVEQFSFSMILRKSDPQMRKRAINFTAE